MVEADAVTAFRRGFERGMKQATIIGYSVMMPVMWFTGHHGVAVCAGVCLVLAVWMLLRWPRFWGSEP